MEKEIMNEIDKNNRIETYKNIVDMLHEFDYYKNSKLDAINFLAYCINVIAQIMEEENE